MSKTEAKIEQQQRKKLLEAKKEEAKKKGKSLKGVGNTEDAPKTNYVETGKETGVMVVSGLAGGVAGVAVGKPALVLGVITTVAGLIFGMNPLAVAGVGMTVASLGNKNLTPEQQAELDKNHPKKEGEMFNFQREQERAKLAMKNAMASFKDSTYIMAEKSEKPKTPQDNATKIANRPAPTGTKGFGKVPNHQDTAQTGVELF